MAHILRSRRCSDSVCFLGVFCRVDNFAGRLILDLEADIDNARPISNFGITFAGANRVYVIASEPKDAWAAGDAYEP